MKYIIIASIALLTTSRLVAQGLPPAATKLDVQELNDHITRLQTMIDKLSKQVAILTKRGREQSVDLQQYPYPHPSEVPTYTIGAQPGKGLTFKTKPTATQPAMTVSIDSVQYQINGGTWQVVTP